MSAFRIGSAPPPPLQASRVGSNSATLPSRQDFEAIGGAQRRDLKGTHLIIELTRVNHEVWLPKRVQLHFDARVALFKSYDDDVEQTYRDYKKFRTDTKITVVGETQ